MADSKRREMERNATREVGRAKRELQRVQTQLAREEEQMKAQIKDMSRRGDVEGSRRMAGMLVSNRKKQDQIRAQSAKYGTLPTQMKMMNTQQRVTETMGKVGNVMKNVNQQMDPGKTAKTAMEYQREVDKIDMVEEMMNDAFDGLAEGEDEEADEIVNQVFDELAISAEGKMKVAPSKQAAPRRETPAKNLDDDVEAIIASLR